MISMGLLALCLLPPTIWYLAEGYISTMAAPEEMLPTAQSAEPIIRAIERFVGESGRPPERLADLVPDYMFAIPVPAGRVEGGWLYGEDLTPAEEAGGWALGVRAARTAGPLINFEHYFVYHPTGVYGRHSYNKLRYEAWGWACYAD